MRRKQVYVEAIIMEISQNKQKDIGFSGSGGVPDVDIAGEQVPLLFGVGGLGLDVQGALDLDRRRRRYRHAGPHGGPLWWRERER